MSTALKIIIACKSFLFVVCESWSPVLCLKSVNITTGLGSVSSLLASGKERKEEREEWGESVEEDRKGQGWGEEKEKENEREEKRKKKTSSWISIKGNLLTRIDEECIMFRPMYSTNNRNLSLCSFSPVFLTLGFSFRQDLSKW